MQASEPAGQMIKDLDGAASAWQQCQGKGDCVVAAGGREFTVWSPLLGAWSDVFQAMLKDEWVEGKRRRIEIGDFSAEAFQALISFMHSGCIVCKDTSTDCLIELAALSDKYGVGGLHKLCYGHVRSKLDSTTACEFLRRAHEVGLLKLRDEAREHILRYAKAALPHGQLLPPELLEDLLSSVQLCVSDYDLALLLLEWGKRADSKSEIERLLQEHVSSAEFTAEQRTHVSELVCAAGMGDIVPRMCRAGRRAEYTLDVLRTLWSKYEQRFPASLSGVDLNRPPFLGYWVNVVPSAATFCAASAATVVCCTRPRCFERMYSRTPAQALEKIAAGGQLTLAPNEEVTWMLPHHGFFVKDAVIERTESHSRQLVLYTSGDGLSWTVLGDIQAVGRETKLSIADPQSNECVRWFKLRLQPNPAGSAGDFTGKVVLSGVLREL